MTPTASSGFAPASREAWLRRVEAVLKGRDLESLASRTSDGIRVEPLYQQTEGARAARDAHAPWMVMQRADHPDAAKANAQALDDLANGADGLVLVFDDAAAARGFGLAPDEKTITRLLKDVRLDLIGLRLEPGAHGRRTAEALARWIADEPYDPERLDLCFGMDPVGALASRGDLSQPWSQVAGEMMTVAAMLLAQHFRGPFAVADGRVWHDGGATEVQELAFTLATGVSYLRALDKLDDDLLARAVSITLAADQDMFLTLAKFRAMRLLWNRILSEIGLTAASLALHAETSWRMMTKRDPYSNVLRATAAVFGAGLGGASSVSVLPFSTAQGLPDAFARRIARNTQSLLLDESNLWHAADPAVGAGYVEHLTQELAGKAWELFQAVEKSGGIVSALQAGFVQTHVNEAKRLRKEAPEPIVGSSEFTASIEPAAAIEMEAARSAPGKREAAMTIDAIQAWRVAETFEGALT